MHTKNRKLNQEELELWKSVTKNDKKIGTYVEDFQEAKPLKRKHTNDKINNKALTKKFIPENISKDSVQINKRMKIKLERGLIRPEAKLDLHGSTLVQARLRVIKFVFKSIEKNFRCILIITGKKKTYFGSKGIIREKLPFWLNEKELVNCILFHCYANNKDGDDGARYILLRKKEKVLND